MPGFNARAFVRSRELRGRWRAALPLAMFAAGVNVEQRRVSAEIERGVQEIFESALQSGAAKESR